MKPRGLRFLLLAGAVVGLYVLSYILLTMFGAYRIDMTGRIRPMGGIALMDVYHWQPKGLYFRVYQNSGGEIATYGNVGGWIYCPLILLDRKFWHPSRPA